MTGILDELTTRRRFGKFASVGAVGAVVDLSISATLTLGTALPPEVAKLVGAETAIVAMFLVNDRWTFPNHGIAGPRAKLRRLLRSNLVRVAGIVIQVAVVYLLVRRDVVVIVADTNVWDALTMPIAIACAFLVNYVAESLFTWRVMAGDDL